MIEAYFEGGTAAISGAYQYDTGQRLRLNGLPTPDEMNEMDDFLSGDLAVVQVHFSYPGDTQAQVSLAQWDDERWCWQVGIPDGYLTRHEAVCVHVVIGHGSDESGSRNKTRYEGVFTPISRPAPNNVISEDQTERWETLESEVELALVSAQTATENAIGKVEPAHNAAQNASEAAKPAQAASKAAAEAYAKMQAVDAAWADTESTQAAGSEAGAALYGQTLSLTLPTGAQGPKGAQGNAGPSDIGLEFKDGVLTITPK